MSLTRTERAAWLQRERDRFIERPSNAKNRCAGCKVEIARGRLKCGTCTNRASRGR